MWTRVLHILLLVSFLNMLTFDRSKHMELLYGESEVVTDTLFEFLLDDIMHFAGDSSSDVQDPEIVYEEFRGIDVNLNWILPVFYFFVGFLFSVKVIFECRAHPSYFSKMISEPGYYTFLHRLRPF